MTAASAGKRRFLAGLSVGGLVLNSEVRTAAFPEPTHLVPNRPAAPVEVPELGAVAHHRAGEPHQHAKEGVGVVGLNGHGEAGGLRFAAAASL